MISMPELRPQSREMSLFTPQLQRLNYYNIINGICKYFFVIFLKKIFDFIL